MGIPLWHSMLSIPSGHCSSTCRSCGAGSVPGLGTSTCHRCSQTKKTLFMEAEIWISCNFHMSWIFFFPLVFLGPYLWLVEVPRPGVELELQLPVYTTAPTMPDPSPVCDLHHTSCQHWILDPLKEARDWICILVDTSRLHYHWADRTPCHGIFFWFFFFFLFLLLERNREVLRPWI